MKLCLHYQSKFDAWNKPVCADDISSTLSTGQGVLLGFFGVGVFVCSCTHLPVYFNAKRILIWCSKTAPQHKPFTSKIRTWCKLKHTNVGMPGDA